jgi:hypothetical protein
VVVLSAAVILAVLALVAVASARRTLRAIR